MVNKAGRDSGEQILTEIRTYLRRLSRGRKTGAVTVVDVHNYLDKKYPRVRTPVRFFLANTAFRSNDFERTGRRMVSTRTAARGRRINEWVYSPAN